MQVEDVVLIAITGGFASGKTTAAKIIQSKGYPVLFTDDLAKELMNSSNELKDKLIEQFGNQVYSDGIVNKEFLAGKVFAGTKEADNNLAKLNSIVHPAVIDEMIIRIEKLAADDNQLIFVESALIYEAGLDEGFDYVLVISSDTEKRITRGMQRMGITREQAEQRIAAQIDMKDKIGKADFTINNDEDVSKLEQSITFFLPIFAALPQRRDIESDEE